MAAPRASMQALTSSAIQRLLGDARSHERKSWWRHCNLLAVIIVAASCASNILYLRTAIFQSTEQNRATGFCSAMPSQNSVWEHFKDQIAKETTLPEEAIHSQLVHWVDDLMRYYTSERLDRSRSFPPSTRAIERIIDVLSDYPTTNESLRILVTGGSVTAGHQIANKNPHGIKVGPQHWNSAWTEGAWPSRLENIMNNLFFNGERGVKVVNMAMGGADSSVSAMFMKNGLLPTEISQPHVVILAHAANDSKEKQKDPLKNMQDSIVSALGLNVCDDQLPMVVMLNDFYGNNIAEMMTHTGQMFKLSSWYQTMMIDYGNIVRNDVLFDYVGGITAGPKTEFMNDTHVDALMGSNWHIHLGVGLHIGIAWAVLYNLLTNIARACQYSDGGIVPNYKIPKIEDSVNITRHSSLGQMYHATSNLPALEEYAQGKTSPVKFISEFPFAPDVTEPKHVHDKWLDQLNSRAAICSDANAGSDSSVCNYVWMVSHPLGTSTTEDIERSLSPVRQSQTGWNVTMLPIEKPQTGWFALEEMASFSLRIPVTTATNYLTVLSMVSYGPRFVGANLLLSLGIQKGDDVKGYAEYSILGHHKTKTSIHVPHKFELPNGGARKGEVILLNGTLSSGSHFKIAGMALCKF